MMYEHGKSDKRVVSVKELNKDPTSKSEKSTNSQGPAEVLEKRRLAKGNMIQQNTLRTQQAALGVQSALDRVRKIAKSDKKVRFTNLMHHIYSIDNLRAAYFLMKHKAAAGIDGETWYSYGESLEVNLQDLSSRLQRGSYRAKPVRRVFIAKADGKQRPLGVPVLEDKIIQRATVTVMNAIYETDFLGFSYGYRPGKGQHNCLDALNVALITRKVNWVLDADIRGFFDKLNHDWLIKFVEHRIGDKRVIRLIQKWLKAGVMQEGLRNETDEGVPQGGSISPLLANIYLHYVLDLWVQQRRKKLPNNELIIVRWADDFVVGFERKQQAEEFLSDLKLRMLKFGLELHPEKTHILEFGTWAIKDRKRRGQSKPETFTFLGFTHICAVKRSNGMHTVLRRTNKKKMLAKLKEVKLELRKRMHQPIPEQGKWLKSVIEGHNRYYGVPHNIKALSSFRYQIKRRWLKTLRRRGDRKRITWNSLEHHVERDLPKPKIHHPQPLQRMGVSTYGKSRMR